MHITLDCRSIHRHMGGIGRAAWDLAVQMAQRPRDHHITVIVGAQPPKNLDIPSAELLMVEAGMIDQHFEQLGLPAILEEIKADIYLNTTFTVPALKTSVSQVAIIHDVVFEDNPEWVEPGLGRYLKKWSRFAAQHADRIITVSDHAKSRIEMVYGLDGKKVTRIYNGIASSAFEVPSQEAIFQTLSKYHITQPYLLYLGTLEPKKGTPQLINAFADMAHQGYAGTLVLAGSLGGPEFDFDALINQHGIAAQIARPGYIDEMDKNTLIAGAELFVYPSLYEGFGLPPLEAMALGVPCVTSNLTSIPEVVGEHAICVDIKNQAAFVHAMHQGIHDEVFRQKVNKAGPQHAHTFTWESAAQQYLDVCEELVG